MFVANVFDKLHYSDGFIKVSQVDFRLLFCCSEAINVFISIISNNNFPSHSIDLCSIDENEW